MQHQPFELRHLLMRDRVTGLEMVQRAEHPADRVAQLAVGLDGVLQDLRTDALVVGIIGRADPQPQNIGAGILHHLLRLDGVAERLRHLAAVLVQREAVRQHHVVGRAAAGAAAFQQRGMEPAAMLVASLPDTSRCRRRRRPCGRCCRASGNSGGLPARRHGSSRNRTRRRRCRRPSSSLRRRVTRESARARRPCTRRRRLPP